MIKKFSFLLLATLSFVAIGVSQANAALNITINQVANTISFYGTGGVLSDTLPKNFTIVFNSPQLANPTVGFGNTTISPGAELSGGPINLGPSVFGPTVSTLNTTSLTQGFLTFKGTNALDTFYSSTGFFTANLSGANFAGIANGTTFHSDFMFDAGIVPSVFSGGVNLTITGVSAVPEPASMVYGSLVAGSMGLTYLRRRRAAKLA